MVAVTVTRASPSLLSVSSVYDELVISAIKSVPGRTWNKANRVWLLPANPDALDALKRFLPRYASLRVQSDTLRELEAMRAGVAAAAAVREAGDSRIPFDYVTPPYAHQRAGLEFLTHLGSGALLWEMGTGKTKTAIDYVEWLAHQSAPKLRVLVICPNSVKRNWRAELAKHANVPDADVVVPDGTLPQRAKAIGSRRWTIVNCEQLSYGVTAKAMQAIEWDVVIVDESTRFKTPGAARTKALHKLRARIRLALTGTPITGKPQDAWAQLEFVQPGLFGSFWAFRDRYLEIGWFKQVVGIKPGRPAEELAAKIASRAYRVLKRDVLDLPEKTYEDRVVELSGDQARAYAQMKHDLRVEIEDTPKLSAANVLTMLLRLTQITAGLIGERNEYRWLPDNAKVTELDDLLLDELAGEQVVIFGQYQRELEELAKRYLGDGAEFFDPTSGLRTTKRFLPILYGPTPEHVRHDLVEQFQRGDRRLLFCQNRTGGIGINLTAAQTAIYVTRSWSLEDWLQSQDRLHRIGQRGTVTIVSLTARGTVDEEIAKALAEKQDIADYLTGDSARQLVARVLEA